jgi:hypothetical protein
MLIGDAKGIYLQSIEPTRCERVCGAVAACDERLPGMDNYWCDGKIQKWCVGDCTLVDDGCEFDCGADFCCDGVAPNTADECLGNEAGERCLGTDTNRPCEAGCINNNDCPGPWACKGSPSYECYRGSCWSNTHCKDTYCCEAEVGKDADGDRTADDCVGIGTRTVDNKYLCIRSSPAEWVECNENNLNEIREGQICTSDGWVTAVTREPTILDLVIQLIRNLLSSLKLLILSF